MTPKFFVCSHCKNMIEMIEDHNVPVMCCGQKMTELVPGTVEASVEKHLPVAKIKCKKLTVDVGSVEHPMTEAHYIPWIYLVTDKRNHRVNLLPTDKPVATFSLGDEKPVAVYAYCNLHGLWKIEF